jgi:hypothetical protein
MRNSRGASLRLASALTYQYVSALSFPHPLPPYTLNLRLEQRANHTRHAMGIGGAAGVNEELPEHGGGTEEHGTEFA